MNEKLKDKFPVSNNGSMAQNFEDNEKARQGNGKRQNQYRIKRRRKAYTRSEAIR